VNSNVTQRVTAFSSIASLLGAAGQANYAAANGALDRWAIAAQSSGSPGVSVQWGAWSGPGVEGMAASDPGGVLSRMRRLGFGVLTPDQGLHALERLVSGLGAAGAASPGPCAVVAVSPFDPGQIGKASASSPIGVIFDELCEGVAADMAATAAASLSPSSYSRSSITAALAHWATSDQIMLQQFA